jgi:ATP-binding cassette subfamily F protein uup
MAPPLLHLRDIHLTFGATPLLMGAELAVGLGDRVCLVGRNGSGKSTLLRIAQGLIEPDAGTRFLHPAATLRYLPQEPDFAGFDTTLAYVEAGFAAAAGDRHRARYLLETLGLSGAEHPDKLSGGEARRAALARVLTAEPDILLLDEPTNHLDLPGIEWLEAELSGLRSGIVLISHDRRLLERLSRRTVWLDRGVTRVLEDGFAGFEAWRDAVLEQEEIENHKLSRRIAREEDWLRYGVTARRKRNVRRLAQLGELRKKRRELVGPLGKPRMATAEAELSGRAVIVAEGVGKVYGDRHVVRAVDARVMRGDRVGIVGPNGAGKTTLLNLLTGVLPPDTGAVRLGTNLEAVTLDQRRESLDPTLSLARTLAEGGGDTIRVAGQTRHVIGYMKDFLFAPEQANTPVGTLSGGERGRLTLARAFARPSNLMVLDEPTNDLDLETLELLQERLADYDGTVLLVSHDRDFLDRVATSVIAAEGDGRWVEYAGGYSDMLSQRGSALGRTVAASKPRGAEPRARPATPARRMAYKDRHALETLPARIEELAAAVARWTETLADPDLYRRDPAGFSAAGQALEAARTDLAAAEERWLELEMLREALEG